MGTRETWAEVDLNALKYNYDSLINKTGVSLFPVVKANAYGHGDVEVSKYLETLDVPLLCVSSLDEAIHLKESGITSDILIFSYVNPSLINQTKSFDFLYTIPNKAWVEEVLSLNMDLKLHLEYNAGMNRYGLSDLNEILEISDKIRLEGLYMHFQKPEVSVVTQGQLDQFKNVLDALKIKPKWVHVGNAALEIINENKWINAFRVGLGLYGYRDDYTDLLPVLSLYTRITHRELLDVGESIGYNYNYTVKEAGYFGTIPIGYADGFDMMNYKCPVYIHDLPYQIVGNICMDQTMIKIDKEIEFYDIVELLGKNRKLNYVSSSTKISKYVILTTLGTRVNRIFKY